MRKTFFLKFVIFNLKDFIFYRYICKMYILADVKRFIQEQRRLMIFSDTNDSYSLM